MNEGLNHETIVAHGVMTCVEKLIERENEAREKAYRQLDTNNRLKRDNAILEGIDIPTRSFLEEEQPNCDCSYDVSKCT